MNVELINEVSLAIEEHPLRLDMGEYVNSKDIESPCGTAACIAGHAVALDIMKKQGINWSEATSSLLYELKAADANPGAIFRRGRAVLGLDYDEAERLFHVRNWPKAFRDLHEVTTDREVRAGVTVDRIAFFVETHGADQPAEVFV